MEDIKIIEPVSQEVVKIPNHDVYYMPFYRWDDSHDWSTTGLSLARTLDDALESLRMWGNSGMHTYERMILKVQLPVIEIKEEE